ncbi:MAG: 50S ribosomal protein L11 methyltransferase [Kiloniellales bacterium]|nr:50S ribosomal protein L11 methyltransferase [Kiloniellales bacterium]
MPAEALPIFEAALQSLGGAVVRGADAGPDAGPDGGADRGADRRADGGPEVPLEVTLDVYLAGHPGAGALEAALEIAAAAAGVAAPPVDVAALPARDWVAESQKGLPALRIGRFFVYGAHAEAERPASALAVRVEAGPAFGTGHHESTRGCLIALDALSRGGRPRSCLDVGCGSGILAIAMAKLWRAPVLACDIDRAAVAVARQNARANGVAALVRAELSDGAARRRVRDLGRYDVVVANILASPLAAMAGDLCRVLAPGGSLVLSGLMRGQEAAVLARYRARGLRLARRIALGDWVTLLLAPRENGPR